MSVATSRLQWSPYSAQALRTRVEEFYVRGPWEYEKCEEGGAYLIRRTEQTGSGKPIVMEMGRGLPRPEVLHLWASIICGNTD